MRWALVGLFVVAVSACVPATQTTPAPQTQSASGLRQCPPILQLASLRPLACMVSSNHLLGVGVATPPAVPAGTQISFIAKLFNQGPNCGDPGSFCGSVTLKEPIQVHLFTTITGQPLFDAQSPCQAWQEVPPVVTQ